MKLLNRGAQEPSRPDAAGPDQSWPQRGLPGLAGPDRAQAGQGRPQKGRGLPGGPAPQQGKGRPGRTPLPWWTGRDVLVANATRVLLLGCLVAGPVALLWRPAAPTVAPPARTAVVSDSASRTVAGETAARFVLAWLTTTAEHNDLATQFPALAGQVTLPDHAATVAHLTVASVAGSDADGWTVVVGADVTEAGTSRPVRRYYAVPVLVTGAGGSGRTPTATPVALPYPVAAPAEGTAPGLAYVQDLALDSPVGVTVQSFLAAFLTGQNDLSRYSSPSAQFTAVRPPLAVTVKVTGVRVTTGAAIPATPDEGEQLRVYVAAQLLDGAGQARSTGYALQLKARGGRWEVSAMDGVPALASARPTTPTTPAVPVDPGSATSPPSIQPSSTQAPSTGQIPTNAQPSGAPAGPATGTH